MVLKQESRYWLIWGKQRLYIEEHHEWHYTIVVSYNLLLVVQKEEESRARCVIVETYMSRRQTRSWQWQTIMSGVWKWEQY